MEVVQIDIVHAETLQGFVNGLAYVFRGAVDDSVAAKNEAELGGEKDFIAFARTLEPMLLLLL